MGCWRDLVGLMYFGGGLFDPRERTVKGGKGPLFCLARSAKTVSERRNKERRQDTEAQRWSGKKWIDLRL
ncbi:hypothetical protein TNCV_780061 [Trichonephila clavipes]|nr:hypothetical protein TNCV_780061 [Trichonephila clavipes]